MVTTRQLLCIDNEYGRLPAVQGDRTAPCDNGMTFAIVILDVKVDLR